MLTAINERIRVEVTVIHQDGRREVWAELDDASISVERHDRIKPGNGPIEFEPTDRCSVYVTGILLPVAVKGGPDA